MQVKRWTRIVEKVSCSTLHLAMITEVGYSNDAEMMTADGWGEAGYWDSDGNRIVADDPFQFVDHRKSGRYP